jgi:hypothetical protein
MCPLDMVELSWKVIHTVVFNLHYTLRNHCIYNVVIKPGHNGLLLLWEYFLWIMLTAWIKIIQYFRGWLNLCLHVPTCWGLLDTTRWMGCHHNGTDYLHFNSIPLKCCIHLSFTGTKKDTTMTCHNERDNSTYWLLLWHM